MSRSAAADRLRCFDTDDPAARETYRTLRLGMVVLIVALFVSIAIESVRSARLLGSISAYHYTSAHAVFLAAICAMGALLVVYRGNSQVEDGLLNGAGFLAFIVAVVPTDAGEVGSNATIPTIADAVADNFAVVVAAGLLAELLWVLRMRWYPRVPAEGRPNGWVFAAQATGPVAAGVLVVIFLCSRGVFDEAGHLIAAVTMFVLLAAAVFCNVVTARTRRFAEIYGAIGAVMVVLTVVCVIVGFADFSLFWLETVLLAAFAAFWVVQTVELRRVSVLKINQ